MKIKPAMPVSVCVLLITSLLCSPALAAETSIDCDPVQGFQYSTSQTTPVGHLTYLKIGDTELGADLSVTDPEDPMGDYSAVVGVMDDIYWGGGYAEPIQFTARLSTANKNTVATLIHIVLSSTRVLLQFTVYNDGTGDLDIGVVGLSNPIEAPYLITADTCSSQSLSPGGSCAITVTFNEPTAAAAAVPAGGAMGLVIAGLMLAGGSGRRNRIAIVFVAMALAGTVIISCGGGSSSEEDGTTLEYVGDFDIPSNDGTVTIDVVGTRTQ